MILTDKQAFTLCDSNARFNLWDGAIRSGKTIGTNTRFAKFVQCIDEHDYQGEGVLTICGVSAGSVYRNVVKPLEDQFGNLVKYSPSKQLVTMFGRDVHIFGADNEASYRTIRGLTGGGSLVDEVSLVNYKFLMELFGRQSGRGAKIFGTTNPDNPKHPLKVEHIDRRGETGMKYYRFKLSDNPRLDPEYTKDIKKKYVGVWRQRMISGLWVAAEGTIYPFFRDAAPFVVKEPPAKAARYYMALDYGTTNPLAAGLFGEPEKQIPGRPRCWLEREYYFSSKKEGKQLTDGEYVDQIKKFIGGDRSKLIEVIVDPSAASLIAALRKAGFFVRAAKNSVLDGIRRQADFLKNGDYVICYSAKQTIEDYFLYRWDEKAQARGEDRPIKENDHTKDMERYYILTRWGLEDSFSSSDWCEM